jgi:hypothetical protein
MQLPGLGNAALQQLLATCCPRLQQLQLYCGSTRLTAAGLKLLEQARPQLHAVTLLVPARSAAHMRPLTQQHLTLNTHQDIHLCKQGA